MNRIGTSMWRETDRDILAMRAAAEVIAGLLDEPEHYHRPGWVCGACGQLTPRAQPIEPCTTPGCPGDGRYGAPGRGHVEGCRFPLAPGE
jgi:hypothetical protein